MDKIKTLIEESICIQELNENAQLILGKDKQLMLALRTTSSPDGNLLVCIARNSDDIQGLLHGIVHIWNDHMVEVEEEEEMELDMSKVNAPHTSHRH